MFLMNVSGEGTDPYGYMTAHAAMSSGVSAACDVLQTVITNRIKSVLPLQVFSLAVFLLAKNFLSRCILTPSCRMQCFACVPKCRYVQRSLAAQMTG
jgi:hypothetical protein